MFSNAHILLVDDTPLNLEALEGILLAVGATVKTACNGEEAIQMLLRENFDCVLMDMQMPIIDGLEAARRIRANPAIAEILVIGMTANTISYSRQECLLAGIDDLLVKPFRSKQLYDMVSKWLPPRQSTSTFCLLD